MKGYKVVTSKKYKGVELNKIEDAFGQEFVIIGNDTNTLFFSFQDAKRSINNHPLQYEVFTSPIL